MSWFDLNIFSGYLITGKAKLYAWSHFTALWHFISIFSTPTIHFNKLGDKIVIIGHLYDVDLHNENENVNDASVYTYVKLNWYNWWPKPTNHVAVAVLIKVNLSSVNCLELFRHQFFVSFNWNGKGTDRVKGS